MKIKKSVLSIGIILGIILTMSFQVFAAPALEKIQAYVNRDMTFTFDGKAVALDPEYQVLVYNDRSYVPVRFVAENLGATVDWNNDTKVIAITSTKAAIVPVTPSDPVTPKDSVDSRSYKKLPVYNENAEYKMSITVFSRDDYGYVIYATLENKTDIPIQLDQMKTVVEVDGKKYDMMDATITNLDTRWYKDLLKEDKTEGYIRLSNRLVAPQKMHIQFKILSNGSYDQIKKDTMEFDLDLSDQY